jgi:colanic acid/amylovoran biosynthesis protein
MRRTLPRVGLIALREKLASRPLALRLGAKPDRLITTGDDAIEPAHAARAETVGNQIGVNLRTAWYADVPDAATSAVRDALRTLCTELCAPLAPLPVSLHDSGEDERAIRSLIAGIDAPAAALSPSASSPSAVSPTASSTDDASPRTPIDLIRRIARCRLVITGSYHAGVFALSQGIPVIGLVRSAYYKDKFAGLADQFCGGDASGGCAVLSLDAPDLSAALVATARSLWHAAPHSRAALLASAERQVRASMQAYTSLGELVSGGRVWHERPARLRADAGL